MSLQWQAVAFALYVELFLTLILILPILKPSTWKYIFGMRVFSKLKSFWKTAFFSGILILIVLFVDSMRTMGKYNDAALDKPGNTLDSKLDIRLKQCRGQRNFYITGFSLFLMFIIHRLVVLLSERASLEANHQAALSQAQNVSRELQRRLDVTDKGDKKKDESSKDEKDEKDKLIDSLKEDKRNCNTQIDELERERNKFKDQADAMQKEYDELTARFQKLQNEIDQSSKEQ